MIQYIIDEHGLDNAMRYWLLLELLCEEFKKNTTVFEFHSKQLKDALHIKFDKKLATFAQLLTESSATFDQKSLNFYQTSKNFWKIETSIILDLMDYEFKRPRRARQQPAPKKKEREIEREIKKINKKSEVIPIDELQKILPELEVHAFDVAQLLSVKNIQSLSEKYTTDCVMKNIHALADYVSQHGKKYKNYDAALRSFLKRDDAAQRILESKKAEELIFGGDYVKS